jgi:hypothetical protein
MPRLCYRGPGLSQLAVAAFLDVSPDTVRKWRNAGTFPPRDLPGGWSAGAIARWEADRAAVLTPAKAAEYLDVSRRSIFLWRKMGVMPPPDRPRGWTPEALDRFKATACRPALRPYKLCPVRRKARVPQTGGRPWETH